MFLRRMDDKITFSREWMRDYHFHLVETIADLRQLVNVCIKSGLYSLDIETTGLDNRVYVDDFFEDGRTTRHGIRTVDRIAGLCISFDGVNGYYVPVGHEPDDSGNLPWDLAWDEITRLVTSEARAIFHNVKFDHEFLYPVTGKDFWKVAEFEDTYLLTKVLNPLKSSPAGLKQLTKLHFDVEMIEIHELFTPEKLEELKRDKQGYNFAALHPKEGLEYGCSDGIFTYKLFPLLKQKMAQGDHFIYGLEKNFSNVIREMERNRVPIDVPRLRQLDTECKMALQNVGDIICDIVESKTGRTGKWRTLNVGSGKQLSQAIFSDIEGLHLKPTAAMTEVEDDGGNSVLSENQSEDEDGESAEGEQIKLDDEALKSMNQAYGPKFSIVRTGGPVDKEGKPKAESIFELILEWRHYSKMQGSYVEPLTKSVDKYGDVRPLFNPMGTDTCRLSCRAGKIADGFSGINFQGIPRDSDEDKPELFKQIRTVIAPRPGYVLVKLDFAGEELRVVTNLSGDPIWTDSFLHKDGDVHSITARTLFGKSEINKDERNRGKRCNFAFIYGGGAGAIQRNVGCSIEEASKHMENLKTDVPVLMGYVESQKKFAHRNKCIYTAYGRSIPIPTIDSKFRAIRSKAERCAINYTIQATSADILKIAMVLVDKNLRERNWKDRCRYILTVHDEVVYEVRPEFLMEIVPLLDEWMTSPWKMNKVHGRHWVVPLLTEPGIDINWKARFDFFKMVDGTPAKPSDLNDDGTYRGKVKKDEQFHKGRIFQKIPSFLEGIVIRKEPDEPATITPAPQAVALPPKPELVSTLALTSVQELAPSLEAIVEPEDVLPLVPHIQVEMKSSVLVEPLGDTVPADDVALSDLEARKIMEEFQIDATSILIDFENSNKEISAPPAATVAIRETLPSRPMDAAPSQVISIVPQSVPKVRVSEDVATLRWIMRSTSSEQNLRKLQAICILAEGTTPLRIVSPDGTVLVGDTDGIRIEPDTFQVLTRLFGI